MARGDAAGLVLAGFILLAFSLWLYLNAAPAWAQAQSFLGQLAVAFDPKLQAQVETIQRQYYLSIIGMVGGGLLMIVGLIGQIVPGRGRQG
jgi:hypothetical protein